MGVTLVDVAQGAGGWWVAVRGTDCVDSAVLRAACDEAILTWDGVIGRYRSEAEAWEAVAQELTWAAVAQDQMRCDNGT